MWLVEQVTLSSDLRVWLAEQIQTVLSQELWISRGLRNLTLDKYCDGKSDGRRARFWVTFFRFIFILTTHATHLLTANTKHPVRTPTILDKVSVKVSNQHTVGWLLEKLTYSFLLWNLHVATCQCVSRENTYVTKEEKNLSLWVLDFRPRI